ncbi:MAG: GGDEF domain-containing protein, partial [bacterium]|nr:GGDEF domain-containing protein [bacterium]
MIEGFSLNADTENDEARALTNDTERRASELSGLQKLADEVPRLRELADTDGLTGLLNRRAFDDSMKAAVETDAGQPISVVAMDIDHFKQLNDHYGHAAGDTVLRDFARIMRSKIRPGIDYAGRTGGEEFALGLVGLNADAAQEIAETVRKEVEQNQMFSEEQSIRITVSCG